MDAEGKRDAEGAEFRGGRREENCLSGPQGAEEPDALPPSPALAGVPPTKTPRSLRSSAPSASQEGLPAQLPTAAPAYAELHCLSNYTFLRGASHPEELVGRAHALGYTALAITDECSLSGVVRAHQKSRELGLALIIGSEVCLEDGLRLVLLVTNRAGYGQLCRLITHARRQADKGRYRLRRADLDGGLADCLALLPIDLHSDD